MSFTTGPDIPDGISREEPEHVEEMKHGCFYEDPNPKHWQILGHKVDSEHPASYSDLLLAAQKLER